MGYSTLTVTGKTKIERQIKKIAEEYNLNVSSNSASLTRSSVSATSSNRNTTVRSRSSVEHSDTLNKFLKSVQKNVPTNTRKPKIISEEIVVYASLCRQYSFMAALVFWETYGNQMPMLKILAKHYLAAPCTSVPSESAFSSSAYIARKERSRLSVENLACIVSLQDKLRSQSD